MAIKMANVHIKAVDLSGRSIPAVGGTSAEKDSTWVQVEKYVCGKVKDLGGGPKAHFHLELDNGQILAVAPRPGMSVQDDRNYLYRPGLLHVVAEEDLNTGDMRNLRLLAFTVPDPSYDDEEFRIMVARGTVAWEDVVDAADWTDALRSGRS